jgi:hypothetical protein
MKCAFHLLLWGSALKEEKAPIDSLGSYGYLQYAAWSTYGDYSDYNFERDADAESWVAPDAADFRDPR